MNTKEYTKFISTNAFYRDRMRIDMFVPYLMLGLAGEAGEVSDKIKKEVRSNGHAHNLCRKVDIAKELGDTLWYLTMLSEELGFSLDEIMQMNVDKISGRLARGTLEGNGDKR